MGVMVAYIHEDGRQTKKERLKRADKEEARATEHDLRARMPCRPTTEAGLRLEKRFPTFLGEESNSSRQCVRGGKMVAEWDGLVRQDLRYS